MADLALLLTLLVVCGGIGLPLSELVPGTKLGWRPLLAPVFGFAVLAVATPVAYQWGATIPGIFAGASGLAAAALAWRSRPMLRSWRDLSPAEQRLSLIAAVCTVGAMLVLIAPRWVGGDQFAVFQGNHWDTFGYLESAVIYAREPYSVVSTASDEQIIRNPLYDLARQSLAIRPSAHMLYAVFSRVLPDEAYRLYYAYLVGSFTQLVLVALFLARNLLPTASPLAWVAVALVFPFGFWGQYAFDINSWSQMTSAPALLLMAGLLIHASVLPDRPDAPLGGGLRLAAAIAVVVAGAIYIYPEGFIFYAAAILPVATAILVGGMLRSRRVALRPLVPLAGVAGVATTALYTSLLPHLIQQVTAFSAARVNWWQYFQIFFRGRDGVSGGPVTFAADFAGGLFGLYFATPGADATPLAAAIQRLAIVLTIVSLLVALALISTGRVTMHGGREAAPRSRSLIAAWIGACIMLLLPSAYLASTANYWPAGKAVAYASPVFMMLLALPVAYTFRPGVVRPLRWVALGFVAFQLGSGAVRIAASAEPTGIHYAPPYPALQDRSLKANVGWDLTGLEGVLTPDTRVLILPMDTWQEHHLMVFCWSRNIPFAKVTEVTTGFGSNRRLGALPPPWTPDLEIGAEGQTLTLRFRDGRALIIPTRKEIR
jgi:hypothetical protein